MSITWKLETRKLSQLKENPHNPRRISRDSFAKLRSNIDRYGIIDKPCVNTDGMLIGGHQRKKVFKSLGLKEIECWVPSRELDEEEVRKLNVALNKISGDFDFDMLSNLFDAEELLDVGFDEKELMDILLDIGEEEPSKQEEKESEEETVKIKVHKEDKASLITQIKKVLSGFSRAKLEK